MRVVNALAGPRIEGPTARNERAVRRPQRIQHGLHDVIRIDIRSERFAINGHIQALACLVLDDGKSF